MEGWPRLELPGEYWLDFTEYVTAPHILRFAGHLANVKPCIVSVTVNLNYYADTVTIRINLILNTYMFLV